MSTSCTGQRNDWVWATLAETVGQRIWRILMVKPWPSGVSLEERTSVELLIVTGVYIAVQLG